METPIGVANDDVIAIVLAAGRSKRFGSDKRLVSSASGDTLLSQTLSVVLPNFPYTYLVIKAEDDPQALLSLTYLNQVQILSAPHANCGLGSSLADAFHRLQDVHGLAAAIFLGDMPWLLPATCQNLIAVATAENIVRPRYKGQAGHPVIFGRNFWSELEQVSGEGGARALFKRRIAHCIWVDVDDPGVIQDIDYPADLHSKSF